MPMWRQGVSPCDLAGIHPQYGALYHHHCILFIVFALICTLHMNCLVVYGAKSLKQVLLVRSWLKDRGIINEAISHISTPGISNVYLIKDCMDVLPPPSPQQQTKKKKKALYGWPEPRKMIYFDCIYHKWGPSDQCFRSQPTTLS